MSRAWNSPALNTIASFSARSLTFVLVLPLLLKRFSSAELAVWYLFATLSSLQMLAELGFGSTFVRVIAYAMGGAKDLPSAMLGCSENLGSPNSVLLGEIVGTMRTVYRRLTILLAIGLGVGGTLALIHPISLMPDTKPGWVSWVMIFLTTLIAFQGNQYSIWLQGTNQIAILRRWETASSLASIVTSCALLKFGFGLVALVIGTQVWIAAGVVRNAILAIRSENGMQFGPDRAIFSREVFDAVWPSAWRSGIGVATSQGITQCSGLLYAQVGESRGVAAYLLAVRLQATLATIANASFSSKLPTLAKWWAENAREQILRSAKRSMAITLWTFALPLCFLGVLGTQILEWIGSKTEFPGGAIWWTLGVANFLERYGAIHLQLCSLSNKIAWHIANGASGGITLVVASMLFKNLGIIAFPLGLLVGLATFYLPFSATKSHRVFRTTFMDFDLPVVAPQLIVILAFALTSVAVP